MTIAVIHQPQYFPYLGFFHKIAQADVYVVMDNVEFLKRGLQHRNKIKTRQGEQWLTVPVFQRQKQLISEVKIDTEIPWGRKHWGTLKTNYSPAPYFDLYAADLHSLLFHEWHDLCSLNVALLKWVMQVLEIQTPLVLLSDFQVEGHKSELLINACQAVGADTYLSGSGGKQYMDLSLFAAADIEVIWQNFTSPTYPQLFPEIDFIPNLSILDVLFLCGPETQNLLARKPVKTPDLQLVCS